MLALFWVAASASAFSQSQPIPLEEVVVNDKRESITQSSSGTAAEQLSKIAGGTNFILADDYKKGSAATLKEIFDYTPGVFVQNRFGSEEARISIRGSGLQRTFHGRGLKLLQDGLPLNEADGAFDMQALEPLAYQYVEVFRGANALEYGSSTLGGAVNFVSPTGRDASLAQARLEMGSYGSWTQQLSSGHTIGPVDYYFSLTNHAVDGYRDYSQQNNQRLNTNLGWKMTDALETRFFFNYAQSDSELPGTLTKLQLQQDPRQASAGNALRLDKRDYETFRLANKTTLLLEEGKIEAGFFWTYKDLDHPIFNILTPTFATGPGTIDLLTNNFGGTVNYTRDTELFGRRNQLRMGITPSGSIGEDVRFENLNGTEARGRKFAEGIEEAFNFEAFVQNDHYLTDRLALIVGTQFVYAQRISKDNFLADGDGSGEQDYYGFNPKIGIRYEFTPQITCFANASRSFEPPSFGELKVIRPSAGPPIFPNRLPSVVMQNLEAQSATTLEIGSRGTWDRISWDAAFYHAWIENELLSLNDAGGAPLGTINGSATHHQGIELGVEARLFNNLFTRADQPAESDQLILRQIYNWSDFYFDSDPVYGSNQLAGFPEHYYRAELVYQHPCGFYIGPNIECSISKYPIDFANSFYADPYVIFGMRTGYRSQKGFSIFLEGRNLGDKEYAATTGVIADALGADSAQFYPGNGISFYGGIEWKW